MFFPLLSKPLAEHKLQIAIVPPSSDTETSELSKPVTTAWTSQPPQNKFNRCAEMLQIRQGDKVTTIHSSFICAICVISSRTL